MSNENTVLSGEAFKSCMAMDQEGVERFVSGTFGIDITLEYRKVNDDISGYFCVEMYCNGSEGVDVVDEFISLYLNRYPLEKSCFEKPGHMLFSLILASISHAEGLALSKTIH